jgi:hypothetical protein
MQPILHTARFVLHCVAACQIVGGVACAAPDSTMGELGTIALRHPRFTWDSLSGAGFTLYTLRGSYGGERAAAYRAEVEEGVTRALAMLGERRYPAHLRLLVIAAAAEDRYLSYSYRGMAAQWLAEGTILPLDTLVQRFYQVDDLEAYLQSGSLVAYLLERYGTDRFRQVWRGGPSAFVRAFGRTATEIEADWHAWLRATPASVRPASIAAARSADRCP